MPTGIAQLRFPVRTSEREHPLDPDHSWDRKGPFVLGGADATISWQVRDSVYDAPEQCPVDCKLPEGGHSVKICSMRTYLLKVLQLRVKRLLGPGKAGGPLQW